MNTFLDETLRCEVLAKCPPRKIHAREVLTPECVMFRRIRVDSLTGATVNSEIRLSITLYVQALYPDGARHRLLDYGRSDGFSPPFDLAWKPRVD